MWCYCGGDIDDCGHNFEEDQMQCSHCPDGLEDEEETCYEDDDSYAEPEVMQNRFEFGDAPPMGMA